VAAAEAPCAEAAEEGAEAEAARRQHVAEEAAEAEAARRQHVAAEPCAAEAVARRDEAAEEVLCAEVAVARRVSEVGAALYAWAAARPGPG